MARLPETVNVTVAVLTHERLAAALARVGAGDIEKMAWSPFAFPERYIGDEDENVLAEDRFPMASLAAAILRELER